MSEASNRALRVVYEVIGCTKGTAEKRGESVSENAMRVKVWVVL